MVVGVSRASLIARKTTTTTFSFVIASNQTNANLRTLANAAGYSGTGDVTATINSGVDIYATTTGNYGLDVGSFPAGSVITLVNNGFISGCGGAGGGGGANGGGASGGAGGTALYAGGVSGFTFRLNNASTIRGGGGGGGGGGGAGYQYGPGYPYQVWAGGGGGGGGQGTTGGGGGSGGPGFIQVPCYYAGPPYTGSAGGSGSSGAAGGGGAPGSVSGVPTYPAYGGNGGTWGAAGSGGGTGSSSASGCCPCYPILNYGYAGGGGGAGGYSISGYSKITFISTGTLQGATVG
jgi:hypothetical protein